MKYMLMMNTPGGQQDYQVNQWSPSDFQAHIAFMHQIGKALRDAGEWVDGQGLAPPTHAKLVRAAKSGAPITDGPFPETKEFLAGYWIIEVPNAERAYAIAAKISAAPGPGGKPINMGIEVREVMFGP